MPPVPPQMLPRIGIISPTGGERSKAADAQAVRRQTPVTRAPRSRARLQHEPTRRRLVAKPRTPHLHCAACAVLQAANCQCRGSRGTPLVLLLGIQRGDSLREENTPFAWQWRKELHYPCSAAGAATSRPHEGGIKKEHPLWKENTPFLRGRFR